MFDLEAIFGDGGPLQRTLPNFKVRQEQLHMAERVAAALENRETLVVEAGTGTGKTFAYLVPALLSGTQVLISTGTHTLQDQLYSKDLPLVGAALGRPVHVALLKGRRNYLCRYRLARISEVGEQLLLSDSAAEDLPARGMLARIQRWARTTRCGDLAEVRDLSDSSPVWPHVTSTRDNCLGTRCPELEHCHVALARREALEADIVIVNHHLLLADLALKEDGLGSILGAAGAVILDEAHQVPDLATQHFGADVGSHRIESLMKDIQLELELRYRGANSQTQAAASEVYDAVGIVEECLREVTACLPRKRGNHAWTHLDPSLNNSVELLAQALLALHEKLGVLRLGLPGGAANMSETEGAQSSASTRQKFSWGVLTERVGNLALSLDRMTSISDLQGTRAVEIMQRGFSMSLMPFDVSTRFQLLVKARSCAWIFTSATLSVGGDFSHFTRRLGLHDSPTLTIESPFDYARQSLLYLPADMPDPASAEYVAAVMENALAFIEAARGGAFVLFTSHRALAQGAALLRARWADEMPYRLFVQGEAPRERLLKEFREDGNAVLLGTTSFWEGVDVKGAALRLVIIEKLPFASPEEPLVRSRIKHLQTTGGNAFRDYQLPEAALVLKQGVGRLIRSEDDYGAVVICDPRLTGRSYGKVFVQALPPMPRTHNREEALHFLRNHPSPLRPFIGNAVSP